MKTSDRAGPGKKFQFLHNCKYLVSRRNFPGSRGGGGGRSLSVVFVQDNGAIIAIVTFLPTLAFKRKVSTF